MSGVVKKTISCLLIMIIAFSIVPSVVWADLLDNDEDENERILGELQEALGSEEEAEYYYDILEENGLIDDDGNLLENKKIIVGGKKYTLLQLRSLLSKDFDEDEIATVDGQEITLGNLKTIIDIEDYISYIRENYVFEEDFTEEQKQNLEEWKNQLVSGQLTLTAEIDENLKGDYSGVNHGAIVTFNTGSVSNSDKKGNVIATLSGAEEGQVVTFNYAFVSATAISTDITYKEATLIADKDGQAELELSFSVQTLTKKSLWSNAYPLLYLEAKDITNATFSNGYTATTHPIQMEKTLSNAPETFEFTFTKSIMGEGGSAQQLFRISENGDYALEKGWINSARLTNYLGESSSTGGDSGILNVSITRYENMSDEHLVATIADLELEEVYCNDISSSESVFYGKLKEGSTHTQKYETTIPVDEYNQSISDNRYLQWSWSGNDSITIEVEFEDTKVPTASASVPSVTYAYGQNIPVVITFSEPVQVSTVSAIFNGEATPRYPEEASADGATQAVSFTFLYPAENLLNGNGLTITSVTGKDLVDHDVEWTTQNINNIQVQSLDKIYSFTETTGTIDENDPVNPVLNVSLTVSADTELVQWLASDIDASGVSQSLTAVVSETEKASFKLVTTDIAGGTLTATIPLIREDIKRECTVELYDGETLIIDYLESFTLDAYKYISDSNISTSVVVKNQDGGFYICENPDEPVIYVQDSPIITARFELDGTDYSYGDTSKITYFDGDTVKDENALFAWKSSNPDVASIDANGNVVPTGKAGTVKFILYAFNNGTEERKVVVETEEITIGAGLTPFLLMPNKSLTTEGGSCLPVYWSSNIPDKDEDAKFTFTVKQGDEAIYETEATGFTAEIPGNILNYNYSDSSKNLLKIIVKTTYSGVEYSAEGTVMVISSPAKASLSRPESYYITDNTKEVSIAYLVSGLDAVLSESTELFELLVTRNSETVLEITDPGEGENGTYTGTEEIVIKDVVSSSEDKTSYRDVYTVSLQAKNGTDSSWSCDSYVFYVYDTEALKVLFNGEEAGDSVTLSNIPEISSLSQAEILAMKRAITLDGTLSINYEDYAWTDVSDRMSWSSSDSEVAEIRYTEGSLNENIENTTYTSFLPITQFDLTGIENGEASVSVTHILSGMTAGTNVKVETLENKLYLFSCTPAVATTISYTNGDGKACTTVSDDNGQAAIYENSGITGDIYFTSVKEDIHYSSTVNSALLVSGEGKTSGSNLYPCNNLTLTRTAYAYMYLKDTDGNPYTDKVILRAGVYLNGTYLPDALFCVGDGNAVDKPGYSDIIVEPDDNGKIVITMDSTQWSGDGSLPKMSDEIEYVFEISPESGDSYFPVFVTFDANRNGDEILSSGDSIVNMRKKVTDGTDSFIYEQKILMLNPESYISETEDLLGSSEYVGISDSIPQCVLTFGILWKDSAEGMTISGALDTVDGKSLGEFADVVVEKYYPFTHYNMTELNFNIDEDVAEKAGIYGTSKGLKLDWTQSDGTKVSRSISFTFSNTIGETGNLNTEGKENVETAVDTLKNMNTSFQGNSDTYVNSILELISSDNYTGIDNDSFALQFVGTKDPHVFYLFMSIGLGTMTSNNATGIYSIDKSDSDKAGYGFGPGWNEIKYAFKRSLSGYVDALDQEMKKAENGDWILGYEWKVSGYLQLKLTLRDENDWKLSHVGSVEYIDKWDSEIVSGGFNGGFGLKYTKYFNEMVGPVPVTAELAIGGSVELIFDALTMKYILQDGTIESGNEYLTQLRFYLYAYFFGGLGFDVSVVAMKIGAFGQLSLDITAKWLNREYFYDEKGTVYYWNGIKVDNTDGKLDGQNISIDGKIGIRFKAKLLFLKYDKVFCSIPFNLYSKDFNEWDDIDTIWKTSQDVSKSFVDYMRNGTTSSSLQTSASDTYETISLLPVTEDFSYLENDERSWNESSLMLASGSSLMTASAGNNDFTIMQSNAYAFSQPELSEDGEIIVYLSDSNGETGSIQTAYALKNSQGGYTEKGLISSDNLDDTGCAVAGTKNFAVAAWYSLGEGTTKDAGSVVTNEEQMIMLEGSEVSAAVYENGTWAVKKLTNNSGADIAPVVAVSGNKAIVAWRSVATSHVNGNITDFDLKDEIHFRTYENGNWSEEQVLYNGTNGNVKGLNIAMLEDGTAAVIYALDKDADDSTSDDMEIQWTIIGTDGNVKRTVQATSDEVADENPQITTAKINGIECFVAAWNSNQNDSHDVRLTDFDSDGVMTLNLPQTVSSASDDSSTVISSNFRFVKGSEELEDLALIWSESNVDESGETDPGDSLKAVRIFTRNNGTLGVSAPQVLADADDETTIDNLDAFTDNGVIYAVVLCSEYDTNKLVEYTGMTESGETATFYIADTTSFIGTAASEFTDSIEVESVDFDTDSLKCGKDTLIEFTIKNTGVNPITKLEITVGDDLTVIDNLELASGQTGIYYADYTVPEDTLKDENYEVKAYTQDDTLSLTGTVPFGKCNIHIGYAEIAEEGDGKRTVEVQLYENTDFALKGSDSEIIVKFCTDSEGEELLKSIVISDDASFEMIEEGGYTLREVFDMEMFALEETGELPEGGTDIYIFLDILDGDGNSINLSGETFDIVTFESLAEKTGSDITADTSLISKDGKTSGTVSVRNNYLSKTQTGNLIITLLDEEGNIVSQKQSYDPEAENLGLIALEGEETEVFSFEFDAEGASVDVRLKSFETVIDAKEDDNAKLALFGITELPTFDVDRFSVNDDGKFEAEVEFTQADKVSIVLMPESVNAVISYNGEIVDGNITLSLKHGVNTFRFKVTAGNGKASNEYVLVVNNYYLYDVTAEQPANGGSISVSLTKAVTAEKVIITLTPYEGYISNKPVVTDADGGKVKVTKIDDNTYSFEMPSSSVTVSATFKLKTNPDTGDSNHTYIWLGLMIMSLAVIGNAVICSKRKRTYR